MGYELVEPPEPESDEAKEKRLHDAWLIDQKVDEILLELGFPPPEAN
jgi:hypothetical protein